VCTQLVAEQVELFDPRPLLLPTRWNAGSAETIRDFIDEEREIFEDFPPQFRSEDGNFARRYGNRWREMTSVLEAHIEFEASVLDELGRKENPQPAVERRGFAVRVLGLRGGEEIISERLYNSDARGELEEEWPEWRPAHFVVSVEDSFLVRETTVVRSSGSSDADALLADVALSGELARGALEDGSYLVKIGL